MWINKMNKCIQLNPDIIAAIVIHLLCLDWQRSHLTMIGACSKSIFRIFNDTDTKHKLHLFNVLLLWIRYLYIYNVTYTIGLYKLKRFLNCVFNIFPHNLI